MKQTKCIFGEKTFDETTSCVNVYALSQKKFEIFILNFCFFQVQAAHITDHETSNKLRMGEDSMKKVYL